MSAIAPSLLTTEELLALPDDGVERWLLRGQLREKRLEEVGMTVRNRTHSRIMARTTYLLEHWLEQQPRPRGQVLCGEAGVRLRRNPDTTVGIAVVYLSAALAAQQDTATTLIESVPTLVVEILSPNDTQEEINEKVDDYLATGVPLIWVIDPHHRTVEVFQQGNESEMVNIRQELAADPQLPGFRVAVAQFFT